MVNFSSSYNKPCKFLGCELSRSFGYKEKPAGYQGEGREYCFQHKLDGMADLSRKICKFENCTLPRRFGWPSIGRTEFCKNHKEVGMIDLKRTVCESEGCTTGAKYGFPTDTRGRFCITHRLENMVNKGVRMCSAVGCRNPAASRNKNDKLCIEHLPRETPSTSSASQQSEAPVVGPSSALPIPTSHTTSNIITYNAATLSTSQSAAGSQAGIQHSRAIDFTTPFIVVGVPGVQGVLVCCSGNNNANNVESNSDSSIVGLVENSVPLTHAMSSEPMGQPVVSDTGGIKRTAFGVREEVDGNIMHAALSDFPVKRMRLTEQPNTAVE